MIVHCLTTHRNTDRQAAFLKRWSGWEVRFVFGIDYRDLPCQGHDRIFALTCCLCGHFSIWKQLAGRPGWHLITEDDATPLPNLTHTIRNVQQTNNEFQVVKLFHKGDGGLEFGVHPLPTDKWISTTAYLVRDTARLVRAFRFLGSPDRMLSQIANVGAVFPIAARPVGDSTIPGSF